MRVFPCVHRVPRRGDSLSHNTNSALGTVLCIYAESARAWLCCAVDAALCRTENEWRVWCVTGQRKGHERRQMVAQYFGTGPRGQGVLSQLPPCQWFSPLVVPWPVLSSTPPVSAVRNVTPVCCSAPPPDTVSLAPSQLFCIIIYHEGFLSKTYIQDQASAYIPFYRRKFIPCPPYKTRSFSANFRSFLQFPTVSAVFLQFSAIFAFPQFFLFQHFFHINLKWKATGHSLNVSHRNPAAFFFFAILLEIYQNLYILENLGIFLAFFLVSL